MEYHDEEWGVPVRDTQALFERLVLEGMQAGLSWLTILRKRADMRSAFFQFDIQRLAEAGEDDINRWLNNPGVIRHRGKLRAMVDNARLVADSANFAEWVWGFAPPQPARVYAEPGEVPSVTVQSRAMSKALKAAGYKFVGPTVCYAFMQSVGMVNDHLGSCFRHKICAELGKV